MIEIVFDQDARQASAYDSTKQVGYCVFTEDRNTWNITHTIVVESYQGHGLARKLVECILQEAKRQGKTVIASCSYAKKVLDEKTNVSLDFEV